MSQITHIIKRDGSQVKFTPERITNAIYRASVAVGNRNRKAADEVSRQVVIALEEQLQPGEIPTVEKVQDLVEQKLIENNYATVAKAYILYRNERARQRAKRSDRDSMPSGNIPWHKLWQSLDWAVSHEVHTTRHLNEKIRSGKFHEVVTAAEAAYFEDVENAANLILQRQDEIRMVFVVGPSSSGKTTTTTIIGEHLARQGFKLKTLNIDHYFFDLELHPKDEFGDYDFETPQALNLALINQHLVELFAGKEVRIPYYDFKTGKSHPDHTPMHLEEHEIVLIDSLHGLHPEMTADIDDSLKFKLYIEPLLQLKDSQGHYARWTDIRLMRRMLRDASFRAYDPLQTLLHWHYVRSSELRHIIPYSTTADTVVNSGMPYELPLYKAKLGANFAEWAESLKNDPLRVDAWERATRVNALFQEIDAVEDDSIVPENSVTREFIGGGIYKY
ncbi:MAG TPA: ATP cone domain-containing protein [Anaerolineaceae bacterium]|nr:ATP cone domain-containing protein [Anaerolineaceae bacterium]